MGRIVQKFGGTSVANVECINNAVYTLYHTGLASDVTRYADLGRIDVIH